jgi:uncharacterized protein
LDPVKISGNATVHAPRPEVWDALNDPTVLVATIPGCERLEEVGTDSYLMTVSAGVGSIKGVYRGEVRLGEKDHPERFMLHAKGSGGPGTVNADVLVTLAELDGTATSVSYDADAEVGGLVAGVGQRMIAGVAKKTAAEFFGAVDDVLANGLAAAQVGSTAGAAGTTSGGAQTVFTAPPRTGRGVDGTAFRTGAIVGAAAALAGAVVGGWLAGRRRRT